jgi:hypothetical protein
MTSSTGSRRRGVVLTTLLVLLTAFHAFVVVTLPGVAMDDGDTARPPIGALVTDLVLSALLLIGCAGTWAWRRWGVYLVGVLAVTRVVINLVDGRPGLLVQVVVFGGLFVAVRLRWEHFLPLTPVTATGGPPSRRSDEPMTSSTWSRRRGVVLTTLLVLLIAADVLVLLVLAVGAADEAAPGRPVGPLTVVDLVLGVLVLVGYAGMWAGRRWAVHLVGVVVTVGWVIDLVSGPFALGLLARVAVNVGLFVAVRLRWEHFR